MRKVAVIADSIGCIPRDLIETYGIEIVAPNIYWNGSVYRDWIDITSDLLGSGSTIVSYALAVNTTAEPRADLTMPGKIPPASVTPTWSGKSVFRESNR